MCVVFGIVVLSADLAWSVCMWCGACTCGVLVLGPRRVCGDVEDGRR